MATETPSASTTDDAKQQVQDKLKGGAEQAQSRAREQLDQRSTQAGEQVTATADALRSTSRQLREQGQDAQAKAADQIAHHAERVGGYLTESDADRMLRDAEDFGRRQPMAVVGIGLALGFAASRFLKASSRRRYQGAGQQTTSGNGYQADRYRAQAPATPGVPYDA